MSFILSVFGANLVIGIGILFWIVGSFFTMKNIFNDSYDGLKSNGFEYTNHVDDYTAERRVMHIVCSIFFPIIYIWLGIKLFFHVLVNHVFKYTFKFLDKVIPRIKIKLEKEE